MTQRRKVFTRPQAELLWLALPWAFPCRGPPVQKAFLVLWHQSYIRKWRNEFMVKSWSTVTNLNSSFLTLKNNPQHHSPICPLAFTIDSFGGRNGMGGRGGLGHPLEANKEVYIYSIFSVYVSYLLNCNPVQSIRALQSRSTVSKALCLPSSLLYVRFSPLSLFFTPSFVLSCTSVF